MVLDISIHWRFPSHVSRFSSPYK